MEQKSNDNNILEQMGINIENEGLLHSQIKSWYAKSGDRLEAKIDGYIIDIVRENDLVEVQTKNFCAIKKKLKELIKKHRVILVYPIAAEKYIVKISAENGEELSRKKSPAKGSILDIFDELIRIPTLINNKNLAIEILLIQMEEIRCDDGKGSWRRKGVSIIERRLVEVKNTITIENSDDLLRLLPFDDDEEFTNDMLAQKLKIRISKARKITYCLKKMGVIQEVGKIRNALVYKK